MIFCYQSKNPPFNQKTLIIPNEEFIMPRDNFVFFLIKCVYQKMESSMEGNKNNSDHGSHRLTEMFKLTHSKNACPEP